MTSAEPVPAQSIWELTPYRVQVLVAFAPAPELTPRLQAELIADLMQRAQSLAGAAWNLTVVAAPPDLPPAMYRGIESLARESLSEEWLQFDKVMLLAISSDSDGYRITAREFDVPTRLFSEPVSRRVWQPGKLRDVALNVTFEAFAPLARVESVDKQQVVLRPKAAALPSRDPQLMRIAPGDVFRPVLRYYDRKGEFPKDNQGNVIFPRPIPWTFCAVEQVAPSRLLCRLHSGLRSPLSGRRRGGVQQLALAVVPPGKPSTLVLQSSSDPKRALAGYHVYAHPPGSKATVLLGQTDRQGQIVVPPAANPLRVLLARNGSELLARLPIVPGLQPVYTAEIADDDPRLQAEGFVSGLREQLVDLVTRREVLFARARQRIKTGKFDEAEELIGQMRRLQKEELEFSKTLALQQRGSDAGDPGVRRKIDALFDDTQKMLKTYLHPEAIEQLRQELRNARKAAEP